MNKTEEIKKALYKQKPTAKLLFIRKGVAYYETDIEFIKEPNIIRKTVFFLVPVSDMGDADFYPEMDAKLLNRYIAEDYEIS